jgi:hypothetical protein
MFFVDATATLAPSIWMMIGLLVLTVIGIRFS